MPLVYIDGVEGAGKTTLMTRELRYHHLCGGKIFALPGYELLNNRGRVVSEQLMPEEWIKLLKENIFDYAVAIDEIQNFLNKHNWQDKIVDLLAYGAAAQRRKRRFAIIATGPIFDWLPRDLREMFHEVVHMKDRHWKIKDIPRGEQFIVTREDRRGMLSGTPGTRARSQIFNGMKYRKFFNSFSIVDPDYQLRKVNIQREKILVDANGNEIIPNNAIGESDPATLNKFLKDYQEKQEDTIGIRVKDFLQQLIDKGVDRIPRDIVWQYFGVENKSQKDVIGRAIKGMGAIIRDNRGIGEYLLSEVSL